MALSGTSVKASTGSGRSRRRQMMPSGGSGFEPGKHSRLSCWWPNLGHLGKEHLTANACSTVITLSRHYPIKPRIERDHQHLKGRLKVFRGCKTRDGAQRFCQAHGFLRNLRQGFYRLGAVPRDARDAIRPPWVRAWEALTAQLLVA